MKKAISLFLTIMFTLSLFSVASAQTNPDDVLRQKGYPQEILDILSYNDKQDLISNGVVKFEGSSTKEYYYNDQGNLVQKGELSTLGTIPTTDLSLVTLYSGLDPAPDGTKRYRITTNFRWKNKPQIRDDDKIGLAYNEYFTTDPITNGNYYCSHNTVLNGQYYQHVSNCGGRPSDISNSGAGWTIELTPTYLDAGTVSMNIKAKEAATGNKTAVALGKYGHNKAAGSQLQINFVLGSITFTGSFDDAASQASWTF
ncbi:hypothetical protein [Paenibacillus flagellatus]|uniref:hypothetical protein n=1 Tax=Paenibacillus flagellatus TaxID=2211139 RepID=UPI0011B8497A|nr:hypothetical protein [Paenibacillus flagellatus]